MRFAHAWHCAAHSCRPTPCRAEPHMKRSIRRPAETSVRMRRRSFLGGIGAFAALGAAPGRVAAATAIKLTLPWLPLGTYSFTFVAKKLGLWEKRGLDVRVDRGFGS